MTLNHWENLCKLCPPLVDQPELPVTEVSVMFFVARWCGWAAILSRFITVQLLGIFSVVFAHLNFFMFYFFAACEFVVSIYGTFLQVCVFCNNIFKIMFCICRAYTRRSQTSWTPGFLRNLNFCAFLKWFLKKWKIPDIRCIVCTCECISYQRVDCFLEFLAYVSWFVTLTLKKTFFQRLAPRIPSSKRRSFSYSDLYKNTFYSSFFVTLAVFNNSLCF